MFTEQATTTALYIFGLRVTNMSLDTLRVLFVIRGRKTIAWILGFIQAVVFVLAITSVLNNLENPLSVIAYAAGFATGNVIGMLIEERLAVGFIQLSIISSRRGSAISERLREEGFAVTEVPARGKDGTVSLMSCSLRRRDMRRVERLVNEVDERAFITAEDIRPLKHGFWRAIR